MHDVTSDRRSAPLNVAACRAQFPALLREIAGRPAIYFDGPAGSQVPGRVIDAISSYLKTHNANHGGLFATSRESDAMLANAHEAVADFLGMADPQLTVFGANMTTLTFALSRALAKTWRPADEIVVTRLDHDANVTPWVLAARDAGATIRHLGIRASDCTLDLDLLRSILSPRTRLVAVGCASNAVGTVNPVREIVELAHAAGAHVFLDAVHYAPHRLIDVESWGCDFLACSAYKFFGPHVGILWGRRADYGIAAGLQGAAGRRHSARPLDDRHAKSRGDCRRARGHRVSGRPRTRGRSCQRVPPCGAARPHSPRSANTKRSWPCACCRAWPSFRASRCGAFPARRDSMSACRPSASRTKA